MHEEPHTPHIALVPVLPTDHPFWTFVGQRPDHRARKVLFLEQLPCYSEIGKLHFSPRVEQNVGWLDIPMDLVLAVEIGQSTEDLEGNLGQHAFVQMRLDLGCPVEENHVLERTCVHQFQDHFYCALLEVGPVEVDQKVALVSMPLLVYQISQQNANVVHHLVPLMTIVGVDGLNLTRKTLIATGMLRGA
jgi:hypothetical protein